MNQTYQKNQPESIQHMFGSIADQYDRTNAILSFNLHKKWNQKLIETICTKECPKKYLDLCSGTGEIAFNLLEKAGRPVEAFLLDFCKEMLDCAKEKHRKIENAIEHQVRFLHADAQDIPLPSESIDIVTIAYGIRNVKSPEACIQDVYRVLKPGGRFAILELTKPSNLFFRLGHKIYLRTLLPLIGKVTASNQMAYQYLSNSIHSFISPKDLEQLLQDAGFIHSSITSLTFGSATIITAYKPKN